MVALTTMTVGLEPTAPGDTSLTPLIGTVLRMVPGVPGAPFNTTCTHTHTETLSLAAETRLQALVGFKCS